MTMLLNKMTHLRISVSSLRWLALVIYCLSLTILQDGECRHEVSSSGEIVVSNLEVETPEDGIPSPDTGLYLVSSPAPSDGLVSALNVCAYLIFPNPDPQGADEITLQFFVAGYRLVGSSYQMISGTLRIAFNIYTNETFGCYPVTFAPDKWTAVLKDDRLGVYIPDEDCHQFSTMPPLYLCSAHLNVIDPIKNCSQALYFINARLDDNRMPDILDASNGHPVDLFMNVDPMANASMHPAMSNYSLFSIEPDSPQEIQESSLHDCAVKFRTDSENAAVIVAISTIIAVGLLLVLGIIAIVCAVVCHNKQKVKRLKESVLPGITRHSDRQQHNNQQFDALRHLSRTESNHSYVINSLGGHSARSVREQSRTHLVQSSHSYVINTLDQVKNGREDEEELYWPPASKEEDLKQQLKKSKVDEAHRNDIELKEYMGSGRFGIVYRGLLTVTGADSEGGVKEVAVKTMENGASEEDRVKFLQEAAIMGQFNNPYVVKIYGVLTSSHPYMLICELMSKDLHQHLHTLKIMGTLNQCEAGAMLLSYSRQVASAMVYLSGKGYVHCDLAARNILLSEIGVCKISDFGLSRNLQDEDYYVAKSGVIPLRWTAPEAFRDGKFSTASDVWSYGVLLYEIWFPVPIIQIIGTVINGHYRLPSPPGCPREIYNKMIDCWHPDASHRPTFNDLQISLQQPDYELLKWSEEDKATYSENARIIGATFQDGESLFKDMQMMYETK